MNKKRFTIIIAVLMGWLIVFSLTGIAGAKGKTLRMRLGYDIEHFDPARSTVHIATIVYRMIYDHLLDYKPGAWPELENQLAEKYEVSPGGLTYTFFLKKGVQWHKGYGELMSEDVKFSVERIMDPKTKAPLRSSFASVISKIETPDRYTVKFFLTKPDPSFLAKLAPWRMGPIVCKKAVEKFGEDYGQRPEYTVGCGPFEIVGHVPKQKIILKRFEGYHGARPKLDKIEMFAMRQEGTSVLSLQKGELDMIVLRVPENVPIVRRDPNLNVYRAPTATTVGFVAFNTEHPILKDVRVRRAMVHALDRDLIYKTVGGELGKKACGIMAPYAYLGALNCDQLPKYPYDPKKARELLAEAGYPKGFKIQYVEINLKNHKNLAPVLQAYWREVGIETEIVLVPISEWFATMTQARAPLIKYALGTRPPEPSIFLYPCFHSSSSKPGINTMLYKGVDGLLDRALATTSGDERKALYAQIQRKVIEDCVIIPIFFESQILVTNKNVDLGRGVKDNMMNSPYWAFYWLEEIDIK